MILRRGVMLGLVLLASTGGAFVATYALQSNPAVTESATETGRGDLTSWLELAPGARAPVSDLERAYRADREELETAVARERDALAGLFESGRAEDGEILKQVERVITANNALERRTAQFLLDVRPHLTGDQQQRLLRHFADGVREGGRHRWRNGWQPQNDKAEDRGGPPAERGRGRGRGGPPWGDKEQP